MATAQKHIVSLVHNRVEGDSRVIKVAQAAQNAGYRATIVGVTSAPKVQSIVVEGVPTLRVPNFSKNLKRQGLWGNAVHDVQLLVGGHIKRTIPEIVALDPDIIHSHDIRGLKLGAVAREEMISRRKHVAWVHDIHEFVAGLKGDRAEEYVPPSLNWEREFLHRADHLFTVSERLAYEISTRYSLHRTPTVTLNTPKKCKLKPGSPDVRSAIGLDIQVPLVVFVGGASPLRGCDTILEAIRALPRVHLCMVSKGEYVNELLARAKNTGFGERIHRLDYVPTDDVSNFIRSADVGIHGLVHYPNAEVAMPNKLFEYLHAKLPVAVSDVASMKTFVDTTGVGKSFEAENAASCASTISEVLAHRERYRKRITSEILDTYSWQKQEQAIQDVYTALLLEQPEVSEERHAFSLAWLKADRTHFEAYYARSLAEIIQEENRSLLTQFCRMRDDYQVDAASIKKTLKYIVKRTGKPSALKNFASAVRRRFSGET